MNLAIFIVILLFWHSIWLTYLYSLPLCRILLVFCPPPSPAGGLLRRPTTTPQRRKQIEEKGRQGLFQCPSFPQNYQYPLVPNYSTWNLSGNKRLKVIFWLAHIYEVTTDACFWKLWRSGRIKKIRKRRRKFGRLPDSQFHGDHMLPSVLVSRDTEQSWMLNMVFCLNRKVLKLPTSNLFLLALIAKVSKLSKTSFGARVAKVRKTLASIWSLSALVLIHWTLQAEDMAQINLTIDAIDALRIMTQAQLETERLNGTRSSNGHKIDGFFGEKKWIWFELGKILFGVQLDDRTWAQRIWPDWRKVCSNWQSPNNHEVKSYSSISLDSSYSFIRPLDRAILLPGPDTFFSWALAVAFRVFTSGVATQKWMEHG